MSSSSPKKSVEEKRTGKGGESETVEPKNALELLEEDDEFEEFQGGSWGKYALFIDFFSFNFV